MGCAASKPQADDTVIHICPPASRPLATQSTGADGPAPAGAPSSCCTPPLASEAAAATPEYAAARPAGTGTGECLAPEEEKRRLQALLDCRVLDTPAERHYDAITTLLCSLFKVPVAVVGLIAEDRLWFKSIQGLQATGGNRLHSFCDASLRLPRPTLMVVPDTLQDARFQHGQFVVGPPHVRFYCGAPLVSTEGCILGSLAVFDTKPRAIPAELANLMTNFAELVVRELEKDKVAALRQRLAEGKEFARMHTVRALSCFDEAVMLCDVSTGANWPLLYVNEQWCQAIGASESRCLASGVWDLLRFPSPAAASQMLYAAAAIQEQKPFALSLVPARAARRGGQAAAQADTSPLPGRAATAAAAAAAAGPLMILEFKPATNDQLSPHAPEVGIPNFLQLGVSDVLDPPALAPGAAQQAPLPEPLPIPTGFYFAVLKPPLPPLAEATQPAAAATAAAAIMPPPPPVLVPAQAVAAGAPWGVPEGRISEPATPSAKSEPVVQVRPSDQATPSTAAAAGAFPSRGDKAATPAAATPTTATTPTATGPPTPGASSPTTHGATSPAAATTPALTPGTTTPAISPGSTPRATAAATATATTPGAGIVTPRSSLPWSPVSFGQECPEALSEVELGPLLGKGAHGKVYRGRWRQQQVAVKIVDCWAHVDWWEGGAEGTQDHRGPLWEAALSKDMVHPNIVQTLMYAVKKDPAVDLGDFRAKQHRQVWLVQQYCNRGTLHDAIDRGWLRTRRALDAPPDMRAVLLTAQDIAAALAFLHSHHVLHGDLTGGNVLLTASSTDPRRFLAKVSDFGLSRVLLAEECQTATYGTISHMPVELLEDGLLHKATDVYSFGVLCFEMYTSTHAWAGCKVPQIIHAKVALHQRLKLPPSCPHGFKALVDRCLADDHTCRPGFDQVLTTLRQLLDQEA